MKITPQSSHAPKTGISSPDAGFNERCLKNQSAFASFIDLIPSKIYLNPEDHLNWTRFATSEQKRSKPADNARRQSANSEDDDDDESEMQEGEDEEINRVNKFDPRVFKTVSQIFKDFQLMEERENKVAKSKLQQLKKHTAQVEKNTSVKVFNKSQHKSLSKQEEDGGSASKPNAAKKAAKRVSKAKEQKNVAAKRQRQRYDSHTEPQIVTIDHSEANSINQNRKQILNRSGQVVFSKFDFTADKSLKPKAAKHGQEKSLRENPKDYKKLIKKLQDKREHIDKLKLTEPEKAMEMETTDKWKTAIDKAAGVKVKDDVSLLKKSLKKVEKKKEKTRKDWTERVKETKRIKEKALDKRQKNIEKRRTLTKENKMKKLKKKGRIMPGF